MKLGVCVPCHDDARYLRESLRSIAAALNGLDAAAVVVADRCRDGTEWVADSFGARVIRKSASKWRNPIAENFNMAYRALRPCDYFSVIGADMVVPLDFFERAILALDQDPSIPSVTTSLWTLPSTRGNEVYLAYEILTDLAGLSRPKAVHGHRVYRGDLLERLFSRRGFVFSDVLAEDAALDEEVGRPKVLKDVIVWNVRGFSPYDAARKQIRSGVARRELGRNPSTLIGEVLRLRPLVLVGFGRRAPKGGN